MKKNILSIIIIFELFLLQSISLFSQNSSKTVSAPSYEWDLYNEINNVQIFVRHIECHDNTNGLHYEYVLLKFLNTSLQSKTISWNEKLYYNGNCVNCDENSSELSFETELLPNQQKQGDCKDNNDTFRIFSRFLNYKDKPILTKYELFNIEIK